MRHEAKYSKSSLILAFLIGGLASAGLTILSTPRSGKETRNKIREITEDATGKMAEYAEDVKEKVTSSIGIDKEII
jgi:gas vesicle protein